MIDEQSADSVYSIIPLVPPMHERTIRHQPVEHMWGIAETLEHSYGSVQAWDMIREDRKIPRLPRQVVIDRTANGANEKIYIQPALLALPIELYMCVAVEFFIKVLEKVMNREQWIKTPGIRGVELLL